MESSELIEEKKKTHQSLWNDFALMYKIKDVLTRVTDIHKSSQVINNE